MATQKLAKKSLFPTRDTLEEVQQEGQAMLPITCPNQLTALMELHQNTILNQLNIDIDACHKMQVLR